MSYAITVLEERLARFKSAADLERFSAEILRAAEASS